MKSLRSIMLDLDRWCNARLGGPENQTMSQTVGLETLAGKWWAYWVALILDLITWERYHCFKALFDQDWKPLFPEKMGDNL